MTKPARMPRWMELYRPAPEEGQLRLPPVDREINHAAEELIGLLTDDAVDLLLVLCGVARVKRAVRVLLVELAKARGA